MLGPGILPSLNRVKVPVRWTDVMVRHNVYVDSARGPSTRRQYQGRNEAAADLRGTTQIFVSHSSQVPGR